MRSCANGAGPATRSGRSAERSALEDPSGDEIVFIVDDENVPVGEAPRRRMRAENLPHRATYVFVLDSDGRLLVQRRTDTKDLFPGYYDLAAGGRGRGGRVLRGVRRP